MTSRTPRSIQGIYPLADDDPRWRHGPRPLVETTLRGGAHVIQLRLKHTLDREALELTRWAAERTRAAGALLIINDRYDLADLGGADGVHLGQDDLRPEEIPDAVRQRLIVGLSTHTLDQMRESRSRPIDYVAFGPVFGTASKESAYDERGPEMLHEAVTLAAHPVVAIGGIDAGNLRQVVAAGASAAAVISVLAQADDPAGETRRLNAIFELPPREKS
jgi:thiamine-phosphate pyrophosphorylase